MKKRIALCTLLCAAPNNGQEVKTSIADSNGLYFNIKEHYGGYELDSGTALLYDNSNYYLIKKDKPTRILPMSRWNVSVDRKIIPYQIIPEKDGVDINFDSVQTKYEFN